MFICFIYIDINLFQSVIIKRKSFLEFHSLQFNRMYIQKSVTVGLSQVKSANRGTDVRHKAATQGLKGVTVTVAEQTEISTICRVIPMYRSPATLSY